MRIVITTDCWLPRIDGITRTLQATIGELRAMGHDVLLLSPADFVSVRMPYGDSLVVAWYPRLARMLRTFAPDTVHIATQGLLGLCTRAWCRRNRIHSTTAFHTRFPEYGHIRHRLPTSVLYAYARYFHGTSVPVLVPSEALAEHLRNHGIGSTEVWRRGVDPILYRPRPKTWTQHARPIHLYVGRVAAEKNVLAFLRAPVRGSKIVVGAGPGIAALREAFPDTVFLGELEGEALARCYSEADVFAFPSLLDTFGLVVLEALASGVPVAALPSPHLTEIFGRDGVVAFDDDLAVAMRNALSIAPERCRAVAVKFTWRACTERFVEIIEADLRHRHAY